jgi:two-component system nitrogen regulation sensor histidine kinase GlnL
MRGEERALAATSAEFLTNLLASLDDAVVVVDARDRIVIFNQAAEHLTGLPRSQALERPYADVFVDNAAVDAMVQRVRSLGQSQSCGDETLVFGTRQFAARVSCSPIHGEAGQVQGAALVIQDISYQKKLEDEAHRNETLARLGAVIAGVAHEVKNPLGGIRGAAQLLARRFDDDASVRSYTDVMIREVDRLATLVEQLLATGTPRPPQLAPVNVHHVLRDVLEVMSPELTRQAVALRLQVDPSLPDVRGDAAQLTQVFLNLVKNALEAIGQEGTLTIRTRMETDFHILRRDGCGHEALPASPGKFLRVEFADTGPGFPVGDEERAFEPFFSTKSKGTGLGLAVCQRIIAAHAGDIRAENASTNGAVITINLPLVEA